MQAPVVLFTNLFESIRVTMHVFMNRWRICIPTDTYERGLVHIHTEKHACMSNALTSESNMVPVPVARVGHRHLGSEELDQLYADSEPKQTHQRDRCAQAPMDRREF